MATKTPVIRVVDRATGREVHVGRVLGVADRAVEVESPWGASWYFRRRDGRGIGAVEDLRLDAGVFHVHEG